MQLHDEMLFPRCARQAGQGGKRPNGCAKGQDKTNDRNKRAARQGGANWPESGPCKLDQNAEQQRRIHDGRSQVPGGVTRTITVEEDHTSEIAGDSLNDIQKEHRKSAPKAAVDQQTDQDYIGHAAHKRQYVIHAHCPSLRESSMT